MKQSISLRQSAPQSESVYHLDAIGVFTAGLPDFRRGRIVTSSSDVDSWKRKHPVIARRLAFERAWKQRYAT